MPMNNDQLRDRINTRPTPTAELLNMKVLEIDQDAGTTRVEYEIGPNLTNPNGSVQGGIVAAMLDDAAAYAAVAFAKRRVFVPSVEMKVSFFAAARPGKLFAEGRCVKFGRKVAFTEADLFDPDGKLLARMSMSGTPVELENPKLVDRK